MERFRIKQLLKQKGMNYQDLAEQLGIHRVNLSSSIAGNPTLSRLEEIAKILEVQVPDLFNKHEVEAVNGYLEFQNEIFKINNIDDVRNFLKKVKNSENKIG